MLHWTTLAPADKSWKYQRHSSKIHVEEHGVYDIPKVSIKSHGEKMELGVFPDYDEKLYFIKILEKITRAFQVRTGQNNFLNSHQTTAYLRLQFFSVAAPMHQPHL